MITKPAPTVYVDCNGRLTILWPVPKPATFEMTAELFESMVREINAHRGCEVTP